MNFGASCPVITVYMQAANWCCGPDTDIALVCYAHTLQPIGLNDKRLVVRGPEETGGGINGIIACEFPRNLLPLSSMIDWY